MDTAINFIAMIASVVSAIIAIRAKNEAKKILVQVNAINAPDIDVSPITNTGNNSGIMANTISGISGGVNLADKQ